MPLQQKQLNLKHEGHSHIVNRFRDKLRLEHRTEMAQLDILGAERVAQDELRETEDQQLEEALQDQGSIESALQKRRAIIAELKRNVQKLHDESSSGVDENNRALERLRKIEDLPSDLRDSLEHHIDFFSRVDDELVRRTSPSLQRRTGDGKYSTRVVPRSADSYRRDVNAEDEHHGAAELQSTSHSNSDIEQLQQELEKLKAENIRLVEDRAADIKAAETKMRKAHELELDRVVAKAVANHKIELKRAGANKTAASEGGSQSSQAHEELPSDKSIMLEIPSEYEEAVQARIKEAEIRLRVRIYMLRQDKFDESSIEPGNAQNSDSQAHVGTSASQEAEERLELLRQLTIAQSEVADWSYTFHSYAEQWYPLFVSLSKVLSLDPPVEIEHGDRGDFFAGFCTQVLVHVRQAVDDCDYVLRMSLPNLEKLNTLLAALQRSREQVLKYQELLDVLSVEDVDEHDAQGMQP